MVMVDAWAMNDVQYKSKFIIGQKLTSGENLNTENYVFGHVLNMRERGRGKAVWLCKRPALAARDRPRSITL
jgi:hypothetical protein